MSSPRRPIPDLCLIAVFKQLTPGTQLNAGRMSPRCYLLVRAANRRVKALVITDSDQKFSFFNYFSLSSHYKSIYELKSAASEPPFPDYPSTRLSKWNCLRVEHFHQLSESEIEHIVNAFSAVIDLKVGTRSGAQTENLISLLQSLQWTTQLTSLMLFAGDWSVLEVQQACRLSTVVNALTALENLAIHWSQYNAMGFFNLPLLAQLMQVAVQLGNSDKPSFVSSLNAYAVGNEHLRVHLLSHDGQQEDFRPLNKVFASRIVRYRICSHNSYPIYTLDNICVLGNHFPALISLEIVKALPLQIGPLFTALAQLPQLAHLLLGTGFFDDDKEPLPPLRLLTPQLTSVWALDLYWDGSHAQLKKLSLQWTMPNLKVIVLQRFICESCDVRFPDDIKEIEIGSKKKMLTTRQCLQKTLSILHPGVYHERILIKNNFKSYISAEKLLTDQ